MSEPIIAVLDTPEEVYAVLAALNREGVPRRAITIMSSEPLHGQFESDNPRSRISGFAIAGGFLGAICAILLTVITSRRVDLVTGGMPIITPWAFGIVAFELTALGAILATLGRMIYEAGLLRRTPNPDYFQAVVEGRIVIKIECSADSAATAERVLGKSVRDSA
jgi:hypothetical protein